MRISIREVCGLFVLGVSTGFFIGPLLTPWAYWVGWGLTALGAALLWLGTAGREEAKPEEQGEEL